MKILASLGLAAACLIATPALAGTSRHRPDLHRDGGQEDPREEAAARPAKSPGFIRLRRRKGRRGRQGRRQVRQRRP
ncbi:hypothetical protein ACRAWD_20015 [Caulobacter segnis]